MERHGLRGGEKVCGEHLDRTRVEVELKGVDSVEWKVELLL